MNIYRGERTIDGVVVTVNGQPLDPCLQLRTLSTEGFEWGYEGTAPAKLALAMLASHFGCSRESLALQHYEVFMREIVANFDNEWEMTDEDIGVALANICVVVS